MQGNKVKITFFPKHAPAAGVPLAESSASDDLEQNTKHRFARTQIFIDFIVFSNIHFQNHLDTLNKKIPTYLVFIYCYI